MANEKEQFYEEQTWKLVLKQLEDMQGNQKSLEKKVDSYMEKNEEFHGSIKWRIGYISGIASSVTFVITIVGGYLKGKIFK